MTLAKWINDPGDLAISWSIDLGDSQRVNSDAQRPRPARPSRRHVCVREYGKPSEEAFAELEAVVGLKGRRFYGVVNERAGQYRACVRRRKQDDPSSLGLRTGAIEGGLHAFERLIGDYKALIALIGPTFEGMRARHPVDSSRPSIEFYRRHDEIVLYLPVSESEASGIV